MSSRDLRWRPLRLLLHSTSPPCLPPHSPLPPSALLSPLPLNLPPLAPPRMPQPPAAVSKRSAVTWRRSTWLRTLKELARRTALAAVQAIRARGARWGRHTCRTRSDCMHGSAQPQLHPSGSRAQAPRVPALHPSHLFLQSRCCSRLHCDLRLRLHCSHHQSGQATCSLPRRVSQAEGIWIRPALRRDLLLSGPCTGPWLSRKAVNHVRGKR
mmetsp:Transcript_63874/g.106211  ORF Transcript_63874/g.106211 Transcript_63874/m.106211 type:complete len:212 (+) Transcript_63874:962-1597(+)